MIRTRRRKRGNGGFLGVGDQVNEIGITKTVFIFRTTESFKK